MIAKLRAISKKRYWDYFILVSRFLLAYTFIGYGYSKLDGNQFGVSADDLLIPLKDSSLFKIMWFLFDHEPFKTVVGILQIITGILLLFEATAILGVVFFIPVAANIVLMDISFMDSAMGTAFTYRFIFYFFLCFLILWNDRERVKIIWNAMVKKFSVKLKFPILLYLAIPVFAVVLSLLSSIPQIIHYYIIFPEDIVKNVEMLMSALRNIF
ncbi:hypothetical protein SAMN05421857_2603 [Chryseobacterium formosense]|uniref:hypothetical protein n=1 Tax=Chryseobacterium formosense TaxID=236814 RepID=UPI00068D900A|nr:hypothetical protein [Chryseobacterium formosense]SFT70987.1 hypothetical protein SAMN05421857_2603 [Chryseobacterium formosense]